jgi:hypothetical protein
MALGRRWQLPRMLLILLVMALMQLLRVMIPTPLSAWSLMWVLTV